MMTKQRTDAVSSRQTLSNFIGDLRADYLANGGNWENDTLDSFLEALSAWVGDMDGFYQNQGLPVPDPPTWKSIAEMLTAASVYE